MGVEDKGGGCRCGWKRRLLLGSSAAVYLFVCLSVCLSLGKGRAERGDDASSIVYERRRQEDGWRWRLCYRLCAG
uniref:Uncharacterized protein n=1 Tax=Peronospora matthiolae TaxID=2874970 RepID=A0AAV1UFR1_9STRA